MVLQDREKSIKEIQTFLDTKIAPKEIVEELKVHSHRVSASVISLWFPAYFVVGFPLLSFFQEEHFVRCSFRCLPLVLQFLIEHISTVFL
jgi:hypothetical protein